MNSRIAYQQQLLSSFFCLAVVGFATQSVFAQPAQIKSNEGKKDRFGFVESTEPTFDLIGKAGSEKEAKIESLLGQKVRLDYFETALDEVMLDMERVLGHSIVLDESAVDNQLDSNTLITQKLANISFRNSLNIILRDYGCRAVVKDDLVRIMSEKEASEVKLTRFYDCRQLVRQIDGEAEVNFQKLIKVIQSTVRPQSWDATSGDGISEIGGQLVVLGSSEKHEKIEKLLQDLMIILPVQRETEKEATGK